MYIVHFTSRESKTLGRCSLKKLKVPVKNSGSLEPKDGQKFDISTCSYILSPSNENDIRITGSKFYHYGKNSTE